MSAAARPARTPGKHDGPPSRVTRGEADQRDQALLSEARHLGAQLAAAAGLATRRRQLLLELRAAGWSVRALAAELDLSPTAVAKASAAAPAPTPAGRTTTRSVSAAAMVTAVGLGGVDAASAALRDSTAVDDHV